VKKKPKGEAPSWYRPKLVQGTKITDGEEINKKQAEVWQDNPSKTIKTKRKIKGKKKRTGGKTIETTQYKEPENQLGKQPRMKALKRMIAKMNPENEIQKRKGKKKRCGSWDKLRGKKDEKEKKNPAKQRINSQGTKTKRFPLTEKRETQDSTMAKMTTIQTEEEKKPSEMKGRGKDSS